MTTHFLDGKPFATAFPSLPVPLDLDVYFAITYWILGNNSKGFIELRDRPIVANGDALLRGISVYNTVSMHCDIVEKMFTECHITYLFSYSDNETHNYLKKAKQKNIFVCSSIK
jgi:hypothetical protein